MISEEQVRITQFEQGLAQALRYDQSKGWFLCPETLEFVNKEYCESFNDGRGCKFLNTCKAYNENKGVGV